MMKLIIERDAALKAVGRVHGIVKAKNTIPILSNIKLETGATSLCLTTNNLDQQASDSIAAQVESPGATTVEARRLFDIIRAFPSGGQVALEFLEGDSRLIVKCGRSRYQLATLPAGDFPQFPCLERAVGGALERDLLKRLLQRTRFAMSGDETRYLLNGVHLHIVDTHGQFWLTAAATDGKSLAEAEAIAPAAFENLPAIILPAPAVDEVQRLLGDAGEQIEIYATSTLFELRCGTAELTTKLIDGAYPDYRKVIPTANSVSLPLDVDLMQACIARVLLVCDDKDRTVRFGLAPDALSLSARSAEGASQVTEEIGVSYDGPACDLGFNAKRVKDLLAVITGENAIFAFGADPKAEPALITDSADPDCRFILTLHRG